MGLTRLLRHPELHGNLAESSLQDRQEDLSERPAELFMQFADNFAGVFVEELIHRSS